MEKAGIFTTRQTHGILSRPEHHIEATSDKLGWDSIYASVQCEKPYSDHFGAVDDHLIILHRDGPVRVERDLCGDRLKRVVQPGGLFILPARRDFAVALTGCLSTIHLYVRDRYVREAARETVKGDPETVEIIPRLGDRDELIEQTAYAALELLRANVHSEWSAETIARMLAMQLVRRHSTARLCSATASRGLSNRRLCAVSEFVEGHLGESISLADMACVASLSPNHFARQFKQVTGQSPYQYLVSMRIEAAKRLLRTDLSIAEIAFRCGFSHQEHLTRTFHRSVGLPPAAYRRSLAN